MYTSLLGTDILLHALRGLKYLRKRGSMLLTLISLLRMYLMETRGVVRKVDNCF